MVISPEEAAKTICLGTHPGPMNVSGRLDLTKFQGTCLPAGLHCYELDASGSQLTHLPKDLRVDGRLVLDNCVSLESLPEGLAAGSISLRNCASLRALPEDLSTWFLDLTACSRFDSWPRRATIRHGSLILRNCVALRELPAWIGRLA